MEVSSDDGGTWRPAPLKSTNTGWSVVVTPATPAPAGVGNVSFRARSVDLDGNTVEQTIIRAFQLR